MSRITAGLRETLCRLVAGGITYIQETRRNQAAGIFIAATALTVGFALGAGLARPRSHRADLRVGEVSIVQPVMKRDPEEIASRACPISPALPTIPPIATKSKPTATIQQIVAAIAAYESLPPELLHSVIKVESNYNPKQVSRRGAQGLMQLVPATAQRFGVDDPFSPLENIRGGAKYLHYLLNLYHGDYVMTLAAYNAGEGAVTQFGGVPPYAETRHYLTAVKKQLERSLAAQSATAATRDADSHEPVNTDHLQPPPL